MNSTTDPADERAQARRDALALTIAGPLVTALLIALWVLLGSGYFWPIWPMLGMSIALLVGLWRAFGPLPAAHTAGAATESRPEPM
jgi:hypothetical protein